MSARVEQVTAYEATEALKLTQDFSSHQLAILDDCLRQSSHIFIGYIDTGLVCCWGLIPPTLLSNQAYLWLLHTEKLNGNEFVFVRHSQQVLKRMLEYYPRIVGVTKLDMPQSMKWIRWLGGNYSTPREGYARFVIEHKDQPQEAAHG